MKKVVTIVALAFAIVLTAFHARTQEKVDVARLPFSPAVKAENTLYLSGQIPVKADGTPVTGSVADETRQVMNNLGETLTEYGYTFDDVVSVTVYLKDMKDYAEMNSAYAPYFKEGFPARACVGGLQIAFGASLEISCIAYKDE